MKNLFVRLLIFVVGLQSLGVNGVVARAQDAHVWSARLDPMTGGVTYTITPHDAQQQLRFHFDTPAARQPLDMFKVNPPGIKLRSWEIVGQTNQADQLLAPSQMITLFYWHANYIDPAKQGVPDSKVDADELKKLRWTPKLLPTAALANAAKTDEDWYRAALEEIMSRPSERSAELAEMAIPSRDLLSYSEKGRSFLEKVAAYLQTAADQSGVRGDREMQSHLQRKANLFRAFKSQLSISKDQNAEVAQFRWRHKNYHWSVDKVLIAFQFLSALSEKMSLSEDLALRLQEQIDYADRNGITLDPAFVTQARRAIDTAGRFDNAVAYALFDTTVDWLQGTAIGTLQEALPVALKELAKRLASSLSTQFPYLAGYSSGFASGVVSTFAGISLGAFIADVAFNTGGIYDGIKTSEFSFKCSEQFDKIKQFAADDLMSATPQPNSMSAWANAVYLRELSVANYHSAYAELLDGARLTKVAANLWTRGSIDDSIVYHEKASNRILGDADNRILGDAEIWIHPLRLQKLLDLHPDFVPADPAIIQPSPDFFPANPPIVQPPPAQVSAPVLVIDRSGSIANKPGVMNQVQNKAEEVVRAIRAAGMQAAVINFSGSGRANLDADYTDDPDTLLNAIQNPSIKDGGTAIYDAITGAVDVAARRGERTMLILLTDGVNHEGQRIDDAIRYCKQKTVPVVIVGFEGTEGRNEKDLSALATSTGGFYTLSENSNIEAILRRFTSYNASKKVTRPRGRAD